MALKKITNIEGLDDAFEDLEIGGDDTSPDASQFWFDVVSEELPAESAKENRVIRKNFIYWHMIKDLGQTYLRRRIKDDVVFDQTKKQWVIKKLAHNSYIKRFPEEWNAFMKGVKVDDYGTPLSLLFRHDPSKVMAYQARHITTVDRLAALTQTEMDMIGMGAQEDVQAAKKFLSATHESASATEAQYLLEEQKKENEYLQSQLRDLQQKFEAFVAAEDEEKPVRKSPKRKVAVEAQVSI